MWRAHEIMGASKTLGPHETGETHDDDKIWGSHETERVHGTS